METGWPEDHGFAFQAKAMVKMASMSNENTTTVFVRKKAWTIPGGGKMKLDLTIENISKYFLFFCFKKVLATL